MIINIFCIILDDLFNIVNTRYEFYKGWGAVPRGGYASIIKKFHSVYEAFVTRTLGLWSMQP